MQPAAIVLAAEGAQRPAFMTCPAVELPENAETADETVADRAIA